MPDERSARSSAWLLLGSGTLAAWDVWRLGLCADDFIFLDAVRRFPASEVLLGQHGIWPWYRPLSAILYFYALNAAGPFAVPVARAISSLCLLVLMLGTYRAGERLIGARAAAIGACALGASAGCKFMVGWASGFQDLLATTLTVWSVVFMQRGRPRGALVCAALAPFAKETGFLAFPLIAGYAWLAERPRPRARWWAVLIAIGACAAAIHLAVRASWRVAPGPARESVGALEVLRVCGQLLSDFVPASFALGPQIVVVLLAGLATWRLIGTNPPIPRRFAPPASARAFLVLAAFAGLAPLIAAPFLALYKPAARFGVQALPWLALLAGAAIAGLPRRLGTALAVTWIALEVWSFGYVTPNLDRPEGWQTNPLGWRELVKIDARTRRLSDDLRRELAQRPESTVVLYGALPSGAWFQTMDGPATRVVLGDGSVRAYAISDAPMNVAVDRVTILEYDPLETHHLHLVAPDCDLALRKAANALVQQRPAAARAWTLSCQRADSSRSFAAYLSAAAALEADGATEFERALARAGLLDTTRAGRGAGAASARAPDPGAARARGGATFTGQVALDDALAAALDRPRSSAAHCAAAARLEALNVDLLAAVEYRVAENLAPLPDSARARLARILASPNLEMASAMHVEGGPEASLYVSVGGAVVREMGSYETGFMANDDNHDFWPIPNVLGVVPRPASP